MRFRIAGTVRETGSDIKTTIEANDFADAERIAHSRGISVSGIAPDATAAMSPNLIVCPACGKTISTLAPACPGCGHPMAAPPAAKSKAIDEKFRCPYCQSDDVVRLRVIHERGHSNTTGVGLGLGSATEIIVGQLQTQNLASKRANPPNKAGGYGFFVIFLGAISAGAFGIGMSSEWEHDKGILLGFAVFTGAMAALAALISIRHTLWNQRVWPSLYEEWEKTWMCQRCGKGFVIP